MVLTAGVPLPETFDQKTSTVSEMRERNLAAIIRDT